MLPFNPQPKSGVAGGRKKVRVRPTQRQMGDISDHVDAELRERSGGICELCRDMEAIERAHIVGRKHLSRKTTVMDLLHLCTDCHDWLDETPEGIRARRAMAALIEYAESRESS